MTLYVIVENVPVVQNGEYTTEDMLVKAFGYFLNPPEDLINRLNSEFNVGKIESDEDYETDRFSYVPLDQYKD